jgi:hypothetical protein
VVVLHGELNERDPGELALARVPGPRAMAALTAPRASRRWPRQPEAQVDSAAGRTVVPPRAGPDEPSNVVDHRSDRDRSNQNSVPGPGRGGTSGGGEENDGGAGASGAQPPQDRDLGLADDLAIGDDRAHGLSLLLGMGQEERSDEPVDARRDAFALAQLGADQDTRPAIPERDQNPRLVLRPRGHVAGSDVSDHPGHPPVHSSRRASTLDPSPFTIFAPTGATVAAAVAMTSCRLAA